VPFGEDNCKSADRSRTPSAAEWAECSRSRMSLVMWSYFRLCSISRAATFSTFYIVCNRYLITSDYMLNVESCSINVAFGQSSFTDLDFADDVSLLAEQLQLLVPILETIASEAASIGLEVNWQKTKVQALGCRDDMPLIIKVQGQDVMEVQEFVYLGSLIHSSTGSTCDISRRSAITRAAMQRIENQIWRSRLAISTKLKLYNMCILPIFLYGSDCWAISKTDARKIDALNQ